MRKRASISFIETKDRPGNHLKFGGEPYGLPEGSWPLSRQTGEAMQFICQVPFDTALFPGVTESIAYLFMTHSANVDDTWKPDGGENALLIVPRTKLTSSLAVGDSPRLSRMVKKWWSNRLLPQTCVFTAKLEIGEDPAFIPDEELRLLSDDQAAAYARSLAGNKLGGTPGFLQMDENPYPLGWHLLLQLDSAQVPFWINFGDAGIGYAFINSSGTEGKFLWQCL